jgi:hypothetical protein
MRATVVSDEAARQRLWPLAGRVFPPLREVPQRCGEGEPTIPIVQLTTREAGAVA